MTNWAAMGKQHFNISRANHPSRVWWIAMCWQWLALLCVLTSQTSASAQSVQGDLGTVQVEVVGTGNSAAEARTDAIRQALQQVAPQVIAMDRRIENDELVMDRVLSSMNGHIQSLRTLDLRKTDLGFVTRIQAVIAKRDILNFLQFRSGSRAAFSGEALMAEFNRETTARRFRGQYLERLFSGHPLQTVNMSLASIRPTADNKALEISFRYQLDPAFIDSIKAGIAEISCSGAGQECYVSPLCFQKNSTETCIRLAAGPLESGNYDVLDKLLGSFSSLAVGLRMLDASGHRVGKSTCYDAVIEAYPNPMSFARNFGGSGGNIVFSDRVHTYTTRVDIEAISAQTDISRASTIQLGAGLAMHDVTEGYESVSLTVFDIADETGVLANSRFRQGRSGAVLPLGSISAITLMSRSNRAATIRRKPSDTEIRWLWRPVKTSCSW